VLDGDSLRMCIKERGGSARWRVGAQGIYMHRQMCWKHQEPEASQRQLWCRPTQGSQWRSQTGLGKVTQGWTGSFLGRGASSS
jgi:hypothetical protein